MSVSILGREFNIEPGEFSKQLSLGRLIDERKNAPVLATILELLIAKALVIQDKGNPASRDCSFSSHKVYV